MITKAFIRFATCLVAFAAAVSCGDTTAPETRADGDLHFVRFAASSPEILDTTVSFWAKKGADAEIRLRYAGVDEDFLRFVVPGDALDRRPDGSVIALGDSIKITVTVVDLSRLIFEFQPSGLRFRADHPARLKIIFEHGDDDLDESGTVDATDVALRSSLAIWRREGANDPWVRLNDILKLELNEVEADLFGFSTYALAY